MAYKVQIIERALKDSRSLARNADVREAAELVLAEIERDYELVPKVAAGHNTGAMSDG